MERTSLSWDKEKYRVQWTNATTWNIQDAGDKYIKEYTQSKETDHLENSVHTASVLTMCIEIVSSSKLFGKFLLWCMKENHDKKNSVRHTHK